MKTNYITNKQLENYLSIKDLSDSKNGIHSINLILNEIKNMLLTLDIPLKEIRKSPITSAIDNYDKLYYPKDDITKNNIYTRWIDDNTLLRTHTTSMISQELLNKDKNVDDEILMLAGLVYRRDSIDRTHVGEPHQLDVWRISKNIRHNRNTLLELVENIIKIILPNTKWRYNETSHYYTKNGIEVEVLINDNWLEILECGEISDKLLIDSNLNPNIYSGLAMGVGLDRAVMIRKNIKDIRILRSDDVRIKNQMLNLEKYKEIPKWDSSKRDLSICVPNNWNNEIIGDEIRNLDLDLKIIEEIKIKKEWSYEELNKNIIEKLGLEKGYKNVLLSISLSSLEKVITSEECNNIYNIIYSNLNKCKNIYEIK